MKIAGFQVETNESHDLIEAESGKYSLVVARSSRKAAFDTGRKTFEFHFDDDEALDASAVADRLVEWILFDKAS